MKIFDITHELNEQTRVYEGDPRVRVETFYTIETNGFSLSKLSMGSHSGTHMDAPAHFVDGAKTVRDISLTRMIGECILVDSDQMKIPSGTKRLLMRGCAAGEAVLNEKTARTLVEAGVRLFGTDALSIGSDKVHQILAQEGCVILESLNLEGVPAGKYDLIAMPLKINADGSPVRACLVQKD